MSIADACLVRMTEALSDPIILSIDRDFHMYRRHSRHVVPCRTPYMMEIKPIRTKADYKSALKEIESLA